MDIRQQLTQASIEAQNIYEQNDLGGFTLLFDKYGTSASSIITDLNSNLLLLSWHLFHIYQIIK